MWWVAFCHQHHPYPSSIATQTDKQEAVVARETARRAALIQCKRGKKKGDKCGEKTLLWWWNLIRVRQRDEKGYFQLPATRKWVCINIYTLICANTEGYLRLSLGIGRLTHRMTDKLWSPGNPVISLSCRPLLFSHTPTPPSHLSSLCFCSAISPPRLPCPLA